VIVVYAPQENVHKI